MIIIKKNDYQLLIIKYFNKFCQIIEKNNLKKKILKINIF